MPRVSCFTLPFSEVSFFQFQNFEFIFLLVVEAEWMLCHGNANKQVDPFRYGLPNSNADMTTTVGVTGAAQLGKVQGTSSPLQVSVCSVDGNGDEQERMFNFVFERILGNGSFGVVVQVRQLPGGPVLAIKKVFQDPNYQVRAFYWAE